MTRFVRQVRYLKDTPALIQLIARDADYLMVCRAIVNESLDRKQDVVKSIKTVCRIQGLDFHLLQQKLAPVAGALGLTLSSNVQLDYYHLLGIRPEADTLKIRKAFRKKAYEVHPDTSAQGQADLDKFVRLKTAYQTLNDPVMRKHYDLSRQNLSRWHETPMQVATTYRMGRAMFVLQLASLIIILVLGIFLFDLLVP